MSSHAATRLRDLYRKIFTRNRANDMRRRSYPAEVSGRAAAPLIEQLEPRMLLSAVTSLVISDADLTEGTPQVLAAM